MNLVKSALLASVMALPLASGAIADTPANALIVAQNIDDIVAIDPAQAYEFTSGELVTNLYDRLVQYDAEDPTVLAPGLASDWEVNAEAKTIRFTLRDDAVFHSGNPVRSEDVVFSLARVIKLNLTPAFILAQLGWTAENVDQMVTADGNSITIKYEGDFSPAFVMNVLAARPASVVDKEVVMANAVDGDMGNNWLNENAAGSGPFKLQGYRPAQMVRLAANADYFKGAPKMESVIIRHVAEAATQELLLESGDIDMARNLTPDQIRGFDSDAIKVETYPQAAVHFLSFNQKTDSLTDPAVWEAARYLVNYKGMTDTIINGQMEVHQAFWPKGFPGSYDETPFGYDPERAKSILSDAGIETPITVSLDVINAAPFTDMAQSLQASFADAGINFEILPGTGSQVITKYRERSHEAMLLYWGPDFMDPHSNAKAFAYNSDNSDDNYAATTTWRNAWAVPEEMNAKTKAALTEADPEKRLEMYRELQADVQQSSPIVIMFQAAYQVAMDADVSGYVNGATSDFVFYRLVEKN
ncbi:ABC transporter substrate-binding protein [Phaeobacter inhibens]|uniref:ABC transporter substrate-binding protein n=1 Tax=Phaeobacter inhibens TaxID=221822 RepID=UPI000C9991C9|nr:ABC transporter substrate-binding protein [Phaeobacter inhibens]AUQ63677.1 putative periplasmic dipeptide transport protein DppA [Phaeobacter inhibens]AUQ83582.1 putative periplasmic dipeptide transport protein DppA [Phaeobacter inhibens]AUQ91389.1 putative periplasmic dipeptide transport protein DppA [Phaeobacter inhibens]AUR08891.1 putative periplasmic dipeptide transport protein DppA [Phaeobacter inhibens]MDO6756795.1 ABC transporter substrate-binding protein [Phaeobacter inhibens]